MIFKIIFFLASFVVFLNAKVYEFMPGKYTLEVILSDSQESYPASLDFTVDYKGSLSKGKIIYPTYDCKAVAKSASSKSDEIVFHEKMLFGFDSCAPSIYNLIVNKKYYFMPSSIHYLNMKMFDGEEDVNVQIKSYNFKQTKYANLRIKNKIKNRNEILVTNNSNILKQYIASISDKEGKLIAKKRLVRLQEIERKEYAKVKNTHTINKYKNYISQYPGSKYVSGAKKNIAQIKKEMLIASYRKKGTTNSFYAAYLLSEDDNDIASLLLKIKDLDSLLLFIQKNHKISTHQLVKKKLVYYYREQKTFDGYMQAFKIFNNINDLNIAYDSIVSSSNQLSVDANLLEVFFDNYVKNIDKIDDFLLLMNKIKPIDTNKYYKKIIALKNFGNHLTINNFLDSKEYKKILFYFNPNVKISGEKDNLYYQLIYPGKTFTFTFSSDCKYSGEKYRDGTRWFLILPIGDVRRFYDVYNCNAKKKDLDIIEKFENNLAINNKKKELYWEKWIFTREVNIGSNNSDASSMCYAINNKDLLNSCIAITTSNSSMCYSINNKDRMNSCLAITQGNSSMCYSINNKDRMNSCLAITQGNSSMCYSIENKNMLNNCIAITK